MNPQKDDVTMEEIQETHEEEVSIRLINVIFLPFHPAVRLVTLCAVIAKSLLGPFTATYPRVICASKSEIEAVLYYALRFYQYFCDVIIGIDLFLHIVHRQVTEEASKREHAAQSLVAICLDALSLIPFFSFIVQQTCPPTKLWPNIMAFTESLCFYRAIEYFDLKDTHSAANIFIGYTIVFLFMINLVGCFVILLTYHGLCSACTEGLYDWRLYFKHKFPNMDSGYNLYDFAIQLSATNLFFVKMGEFRPAAYLEFVLFSILIIMGFLFLTFIIGPKIFAELMLRTRKNILFHTRANRIIEEAKKRNQFSDSDDFDQENYFSIIWKKMEGVTVPPSILIIIPRYMKLYLKEDVAWAVFHHSPTLRRTSSSYKRWMYDHMNLQYKMPGERLFSGRHCFTHLYYLKTGIVQLLSTDDGTSPVLSVTGGSLFGDISFYLPPLHRQALVRCLTYCEIIALPRAKLLSSMHKFPEDRSMILKSVSERIKHARILNSCKLGMRGLDRTEDEGLAWLKTRWWALWTAIQHWKKSSKKETQKCTLPAEKSSYHCSKYIGQLVLCTKDQLQLSTIFAKVTFPWILSANSSFNIIWHKIVKFFAFMVLILFPPNIAKEHTPDWFDSFSVVVNIVYIADIFFCVITKADKQRNDVDFKVTVLAKFKSWRFVLDVLSIAWLRQLFAALGQDALARVAPLACLLKLHVFFDNKFETWKRNTNLLTSAIINYLFLSFATLYVFAYLSYIIVSLLGKEVIVSTRFLFGPLVCSRSMDKSCKQSVMWVFYYFILQYHFAISAPKSSYATLINTVKSCIFYFLDFYGQYKISVAYFFKYHDISKYSDFVTSLKWFYQKYELHPDALKRVERYFLCQWKSNYGMSIMYPNATEGESDSMYWAHHGRAAERIIGSSTLFADSHHSLIRDLAEKSRFSLVPQGFTLILFGVQCNCITWLTNGELKCEYKNENGDIVSHYSKPTDILMLNPLFPGLPAFKTYITATECEILYITKRDFFQVMKQHPEESLRIITCVDELSPMFDEIFRKFLKQHQSYQKKLRERIFHDRKSVFAVTVKQKIDAEDTSPTSVPFGTFISSPEAPFVKLWITVRMLVAVLSILNINVKCYCIYMMSGYTAETFFMISSFCDILGFADIILKLFLPYYDDRGLIVSDYKKCMKHYLSRGFIVDMIGTCPWKYIALLQNEALAAYAVAMEIEIYMKYAHLYILSGYFNYIVDRPCSYRNHVLFIKWQLITFLVLLAAGTFFFLRCFEFKFDESLEFVSSTVRRGNSCWNPTTIGKKINHTSSRYPYRIVGSIEMALNLMLGVFRPEYNPHTHGTAMTWLVGLLLKLVFWFICLYSQTLLMLNAQTNTSFQHGVQELVTFLKDERVEKPTIQRCVAHYNYMWLRTKGVSAEKLYNNIGTGNSLSQDINFYIFKSAYEGLNTIFNGDEVLERKLSGVVTNRRFLPNEDIMREMDLVPFVYIVHRGQVTISRRGRNLTTVTMGGLFGQLSGMQPRPVRVTARTDGYTDVLELSIIDFQDIFAHEYKDILTKNQYDFIKVKRKLCDVPSLKVEYMIRGIRIFKFPFIMSKPVDIRSCVWYERFLYFVWIWISTAIVFIVAFGLILTERPRMLTKLIISGNICEIFYLVYYITELFTMELVIVNNKIECRYFKWRLLFQWSFILNTISLFCPKLEYAFMSVSMSYYLDLTKMLRIHVYFYFYEHFCNNFQNKYSPVLLKLVILINIVQFSACLWISTTCDVTTGYIEHYKGMVSKYAPDYVTKTVDWNDWSLGTYVIGCGRRSQSFETPFGAEKAIIITRFWYGDYVMALWYMLTVLAQIEIDVFGKFGLVRILNVFLTLIMKWSKLWISAVGITFFFTNFNELYAFERKIEALKTYYKCNGLSNALLEALDTYAKQLWKRQKGSSLPKFAQKAPLCLKQDIFSSLYMHHLRTPTLFQVFPEYFLRQLVVRVVRKVVFPGNYIVQEGDIHPTLYFIHKGEVEKWCTDAKGETKMSCVLTMNGYFGLVPALFPNAHYQFAYYSRTVVDLICLNYNDWQDLLEAYPDIKVNLYKSAQKYKRGDKHGKSKLDAETPK